MLPPAFPNSISMSHVFMPSIATLAVRTRRALLIAVTFCLGLLVGESNSVLAQSSGTDYSRLVHPEVAEELGLDDGQRAKLQQLLQRRTELQVAEQTEETKQQIAQTEQQIRETLTAKQLQDFQAAAPTSDLQFQFRDQAWSDVLNWFARQEGLTLVMDRAPPGTFTYTDDRGYSSAEAIDLLNSVLLTRGFTLVRREKMLTLLQLSESIPIELIPRVKLEELASRGRFELVSVLFPLGARPVDAVMAEVNGYLGNYGRAIPLPQSKQLLVVESAGKMQTINVLIQSVPEPQKPAAPQPQPKPPEPVFAAYPLGELDPSVTLELVRGLVGSDRIAVDSGTRLLTAFVPPGQQQAIQSVIEQMRQSSAAAPESTSVAYRIDPANEEALRSQISAIAPRAVIAMDAIGKKLLVTASASEQASIKDALAGLGVSADQTEQKVRSYVVESAEATTLAAALQQMLPNAQTVGNATLGTVVVRGAESDLMLADEIHKRFRGEETMQGKILHAFPLDRVATVEWLTTVEKVVPKAQVWLDENGRRLMLLGSMGEKQTLESMLPQLLTSIPVVLEPVLRTYELSSTQWGQWQQLQPTLSTELANSQIIPQPAADGVPAKLMVWGPEKSQARITEILDQLNQPGTDQPLPLPKKHLIKVEESELVIAVLRDRYPELRMSESADGESITVWANEETQLAIMQLLEAFQAELTPRTELTWESYASNSMTAAALQTLLQPMLTQAGSSGSITVDASSGRLLIWAEPEVHKQLAGFVKQLEQDRPLERTPILLAYTLQHADAAGLKTLLDATLSGATIVADNSRRQLVVTGTLEQHGQVKSILAELDREPSAALIKELRTYTLHSVQATPLLPTLQSLFPAMQLSIDAASNQIIASGSLLDHQALREAIERLQATEESGQSRVETYTLSAGDLRTLPAVLTQLAPRAVISPDLTSGTIVVWGTNEDHQRIGQAIAQLSEAVAERQQLNVFQARPDRLLELQTSIRSLFPTASVAVETAAGRLTVLAPKSVSLQIEDYVQKTLAAEAESAKPEPQAYKVDVRLRPTFATLLSSTVPRATVVSAATTGDQPTIILALPEDHERINDLLEKLKQQTSTASENEVRVYSLEKIDPAAFANMLAVRRPVAQVVSGAATDKPVVSDTSQGHAEIAKMVAELRIAFEQTSERSLRVFQVREDLLASASTGLVNIAPKATILPSQSAERLVVQATKEDLQKIEVWLAEMDQAIEPPVERFSRVYPLVSALPTTAAVMLRELLPAATFAADTTNGSVGATATEEEHERIAELIEQFNSSDAKTEALKAYRLQHAEPAKVVEALSQAFGRRSTAGVSFDEKSGVVFVVGLPEQQKIAASLIEQMDQEEASVKRSLKVFSTAGITGRDLDETLEDLLTGSRPPADIQFDYFSDRLVVVGTDQQLALVDELLTELQPPERELEIFPLKQSDPESVRLAINALFEELSFGAAPVITVDEDRGQLLIRATAEQMVQIRDLLERLGESNASVAAGSSANGETSKSRVRTVLVGRRSEELLQRLKQVWPTLSSSPLRVVEPAIPQVDDAMSVPAKPAATDGTWRQSEPAGSSEFSKLVSLQVDQSGAATEAEQGNASVLILPDGDRWTLASNDPVALEILAEWIENTIAPPISVIETSGNRSIFLLEHAAADDMQVVLTSLFVGRRGTTRTTGVDPGTRIVADERVNAIIVQGSIADRRAIEELLTVLDSPEFVGVLQSQPAEMVQVQHTSASRVLLLLNKLYASQLSASSGRPKISIPTGIDEDVAELLEQINASVTGPLLTLGVDEVSNAIVMRGPRELVEEIRGFIGQVDQQANTGSSTRMRVIKLQGTKSAEILRTLQLMGR